MSHRSIEGSYNAGELEMKWVIIAPKYDTAQVKMIIGTQEAANNEFSSGNPWWNPGQIETGDDVLNFEMRFIPPAAEENGELIVVSLSMNPNSGSPVTMENYTLQGWDATGAPEAIL